MAVSCVQWSDLNPELLQTISKILDADIDILRLRAVCSNWRSSIPRRHRPSPFALEIPPFPTYAGDPSLPGHYTLDYTTLYRLSPPTIGPHAGEPSEGWLIRVLEEIPNHFVLLDPIRGPFCKYTPGTLTNPKHLNFLDHRVTEVSRVYCLNIFDPSGGRSFMDCFVKKVLVLWNYVVDCEFAVVVLRSDLPLSYLKFGDKGWTAIDDKGFDVTDVAVYNGKLYGIDRKGVLVTFDSEMNVTVVRLSGFPESYAESKKYLVEYESELYVLLRMSDAKLLFKVKVFKMCNNHWEHISCLGNGMFLSSDAFSAGVSAEDFRGHVGNCVYLAHREYHLGIKRALSYGAFRLEENESAKILFDWPAPQWVKKIASASC